ncbi:formiminoglutamase [Pseudorhizobium tarimense]|uniref:Formiminoglutamase n=1 Tax=Pseudorhizobium tarimense TaxID=1079109 RepID=A0ABV2HBC5_9HYPH|nr:N-formylglutamate deformylase [Pseudorhizobium tarimense]MCJ8520705.1 N-formylglutamate deformylase [Pseudorhizobium tarimense]
MTVFEIQKGNSPVILAFPHTGTDLPAEVWDRLNDNGRLLADTDWHIHDLYAGLLKDATTVRAAFHRYVIDANRDPHGNSLYPGQNTTGLIPQTDFDGKSIWKEGAEPTETDVMARLESFHSQYHAALSAQIERVKAVHGLAVLYDCHSIRSHIPFLFEGTLPDFNIGSNSGASCALEFERVTAEVAGYAAGYTSVVNGRFKGGWTTRHYGKPADGIHAIQMELAQSTHLATEAVPFAYDSEKADKLRPHLKTILERLEKVAYELKAMGNE